MDLVHVTVVFHRKSNSRSLLPVTGVTQDWRSTCIAQPPKSKASNFSSGEFPSIYLIFQHFKMMFAEKAHPFVTSTTSNRSGSRQVGTLLSYQKYFELILITRLQVFVWRP